MGAGREKAWRAKPAESCAHGRAVSLPARCALHSRSPHATHRAMNESPTPADEQIIWKGSVSQWHFAGRWLLFVLLLAGAVAAFVLHLPPTIPPANLAAVLAGLALVILISIYIGRARRTY